MPRDYRSKPQPFNPWMQLLAFFAFVGFPAFVTAIAPVCVTHFTRANGEVTVVVQTKLLFLIPYRTVRVEGVQGVDEREIAGTLETSQSFGDDSDHTRRQIRSEDEGFLVIHSRSGEAEAATSPVNLSAALEKARRFLADPTQTELRLFTVANWKASVWAGGATTALTLLYVIGLLSLVWARLTGRHRLPGQSSKELPRGNAGRARK